MKMIELIGPSGIGKTTFLNILMEQRIESEWITREEGKRWLSRREGKYLKKALSRVVGYVGLSLNVDKKGRKDLIEALKNNEKECQDFIQLFYYYLQNSDMEAWQKVRLHNYLTSEILHQIISFQDLPPDTTLVLDEGVVHNGGLEYILDHVEKHKDLKESFLLPNGIILCTLDNKEYRKRLTTRIESRGGRRSINSILVDVKDSEIEEVMYKAQKSSLKKVEACRALEVPVAEVKPIDTQEQINKALKFINSIDKEE